MSQGGRLNIKRQDLQRALAEKTEERERVMLLFRRGHASLADTEGQLDAIEKEAAELRTESSSIQSQHDLTQALQEHSQEAETLLIRLRIKLDAIERTQDQAAKRLAKRGVIEELVKDIRVDTTGEGHLKTAAVTTTYFFNQSDVAKITKNTFGTMLAIC
jgi:hypothetical protein